jgi:tetratricopeptide (TPR) repeat protein
MAVYVDDYRVPAKVGRHDTRWSHLWADSQDELHAFAARLGLRRSYFQPGKARGNRPSSTWHYDVTDPKREQALQFGAQQVSWRDSPRIMRARDATAADREAGVLWRRGEYKRAAELISRAHELDPARGDLWAKREAAITQAASGRQASREQVAAEEAPQPRAPRNALEHQLAETGIAPDDPALEFWRAWNTAACKRRDGDASNADREAGQ